MRISLRTRDFDEALRRKNILALEQLFQSYTREPAGDRRVIGTTVFDNFMYGPYSKDLGYDLSWMNKPSDNNGWDYRRQKVLDLVQQVVQYLSVGKMSFK